MDYLGQLVLVGQVDPRAAREMLDQLVCLDHVDPQAPKVLVVWLEPLVPKEMLEQREMLVGAVELIIDVLY